MNNKKSIILRAIASLIFLVSIFFFISPSLSKKKIEHTAVIDETTAAIEDLEERQPTMTEELMEEAVLEEPVLEEVAPSYYNLEDEEVRRIHEENLIQDEIDASIPFDPDMQMIYQNDIQVAGPGMNDLATSNNTDYRLAEPVSTMTLATADTIVDGISGMITKLTSALSGVLSILVMLGILPRKKQTS